MGIWVHPYTVILVRGWGQILNHWGLWPNLNDFVASWLRLQEASDCVPNPYWMYTKCFSTLICCEWAYGCYPYTVIPVELGAKFGKIGVWANLNDVVVSWLRLQVPSDYVPHPYWMYIKCFSTLICCGWAYGCTLILL